MRIRHSSALVAIAIVATAALAFLWVLSAGPSKGQAASLPNTPTDSPPSVNGRVDRDLASVQLPPDSHTETIETQKDESEPELGRAKAVPTVRQARVREAAIRSLEKYADAVHMPLPSTKDLTDDQWALLCAHEHQASQAIDAVKTRRTAALMDICQQRAETNSLERVHVASGPLSQEQKREIVKKEKPNAPGQLVAYRISGEDRFVCRVNPGEYPELDAMTTEIQSLSLLAVVGASQIIQSAGPK